VGVLDVAPQLALSPLLTCYCFALVAALQLLKALHGVKQVKALCAIFMHTSLWYRAQRERAAPWSFDWAPPMPQLVRELSVSVLAFSCLDNPALLPGEAQVAAAMAGASKFAARTTWPTEQHALARQHAQLDADLSPTHVLELAQTLAHLCNKVKEPAPASATQPALSSLSPLTLT
jgi:hypothetical protein